jgi:GNAT superfamily N-acetyltransferase
MSINTRQARESDAAECGRICYEAFARIASAHNFPADFPNVDIATGMISMLLGHPGFYGILAEDDGRIVGSNFVDERGAIFGIGPITIDPSAQNQGTGALLMHAAMTHAEQKGAAGVRLVQAGYHCRSLALYSKLGFDIRQQLCCLQGPAVGGDITGYRVRQACEQDLAACNALAERIHGHHRGAALRDAISRGTASVVVRSGRITGYASQIGFFGHANAETTDDIKALITATKSYAGPGFLVPSSNGELLRWCLSKGLRITQPMTLMTTGLYNEPDGAYLPSISY